MEQSINVKAVKVKYFCDECGKEVLPSGIALLSYPVQYEHICTNGKCDKTYRFEKEYPSVEFFDLD